MKLDARTCFLSLLLAACTLQPPQTLLEKLEGKTPQEKQEVLRLACLNEAEWSTIQEKRRLLWQVGPRRIHQVEDTGETYRLKTLCVKMTGNYVGLN